MSSTEHLAIRRRVLEQLGGPPATVEAALRYNENLFDPGRMPPPPVLPLPDEAHLIDWRRYAEGAANIFPYLQSRLVQLCIPIREGVSNTEAYRNVIRRGQPFDPEVFGGQLTLERPDELQLQIHDHPAGALPVLIASHRPDFLTLDRALAFRSEPAHIGRAVNAHMIAGLPNWDRLRLYRAAWMVRHGAGNGSWDAEMKRVLAQEPERFYDRLMLVCQAPYSSLKPSHLGLEMDKADWLKTSATLRLEHEFTHYTTQRLYGRMNLNILDEILCDWASATAVLGRFEARWFLICMGLEHWPEVRRGGRVHTYRADLDDDAFALICAVTVRAAQGLADLIRKYDPQKDRLHLLLALSRLTLELMACEEREAVFAPVYAEAAQLVGVA